MQLSPLSIPEYFHYLQKESRTSQLSLPIFSPPPSPWQPAYFLSLQMCMFWTFHKMESYNAWSFVSVFFHLSYFQSSVCCSTYHYYIPFYGSIIFHRMHILPCLSIHQSMDVWVVSTFGLLYYGYLYKHAFSVLLVLYVGVKLLNQ